MARIIHNLWAFSFILGHELRTSKSSYWRQFQFPQWWQVAVHDVFHYYLYIFFFSSYRKWQLTELFPSISSHLVAIKETILSRANMKKLKFKLKHNHHNSYLFYGFSSLFFFKFIIMLLILVNLFNINRLKKSLLSFRLLFFWFPFPSLSFFFIIFRVSFLNIHYIKLYLPL